MDEIKRMIEEIVALLIAERATAHTTPYFVAGSSSMPWLMDARLHALLDCYKALGGDILPWRNEAGVLRRNWMG